MKTILQILPSLNRINGGVERGTLDVARTLAEKGFKSVIISSGGEMAEKYKYKGVDHYKVSLASKGMVKFFSSMKLTLLIQCCILCYVVIYVTKVHVSLFRLVIKLLILRKISVSSYQQEIQSHTFHQMPRH